MPISPFCGARSTKPQATTHGELGSWGSDGVEVTKKLWVYLHDKLTNEYGLNNLIWVWTMQTSDAGNLADVSKLIEAYPGDEYVDIVCADLYEDAFTNHTDQFDIINSAVGCRKIIALGEVGNMLDIESTVADKDNAMWSYFMGFGMNRTTKVLPS